MSPWNDDALAALTGELKLNVLPETGLIDKLEWAADGFMDRDEAQQVRVQSDSRKQMDKIVEILRGKDDEAFCIFCMILRKSNNFIWADKLVNKAEDFKLKRQAASVQREEERGLFWGRH